MFRVLLAGGGTAGHVNPALAISEIIKSYKPDTEFLFAGTPGGIEKTLVERAGYNFASINVSGFQRKPSWENVKRNANAVKCLVTSTFRANQIVNDFKPDLVIGTGGYVSGPIVQAGIRKGIKTAIHEQNAYPGVTTKILAKKANVVMLTVMEAKKYLGEREVVFTGLPVRGSFKQQDKAEAKKRLGFPPNEICILSSGGSLGARVLNENVAKLIKWYAKTNAPINHIHSYGSYKGNANFVKNLENEGYNIANNPRLIVKDYINNMADCMSAADIVISRCGANALCELEALGRASILIPSPNVAGNHQYHNAMVLQKAGAGCVIEEKDLDENKLIQTVSELIKNPEKIEQMGKKAREVYVDNTNERIWNALNPLIKK